MKKFPIIFSVAIVFSLFVFVNMVSVNPVVAKGEFGEQTQNREESGEAKGTLYMAREESGDDSKDDTDDEKESDEIEVDDSARKEKMGEVAKQVQVLLEMKEDGEGIGQRVKEIAKEQVKSQEKIAEKLQKMEQKKIWFKKMFGYDREAVLSIKAEIDANQERIQELAKLQSETTDKTEIAELQTSIDALVEQNTTLRETIQTEMKEEGVWGWFRGFFKRN